MKVVLCLLASLSVALAGKPRLGAAVEMTGAELTDPSLLEIANFAVSTIDAWTNGIYRSKLVQVISAKRQLVAGFKYILELETATTTCRKSTTTALEECSLHPDYKNQVCHVEVYDVPWTGHREVLEQGCVQKPAKRQFGGLAGGLTPADPADDAIVAAAMFAVDEINAQSNSLYLSKLLQVHSAHTQVVAGINYHLQLEIGATVCTKGDNQLLADCEFDQNGRFELCDVVVYRVPWENSQRVTRLSCRSARARRQLLPGGLTGGLYPADPTGQKVLEMSAFAVDTINAQSNSIYLSKLVQVHSASTQVVAGTNYHLELEIGATSCYKGDSVSLENCDFDQNGVVEMCSVTVFDQPWTNTRQVIAMSCRPKDIVKKQLMPGGLMAADINHQDIQQMALLSVDHINGMRNNPRLSKLVEVTRAHYQVVAGLKYYLTMEIGTTVCSSSDTNVQLSDCDVLLGGGREMCDVEVLDQPWVGEPQVLSFSCTPKQLFP